MILLLDALRLLVAPAGLLPAGAGAADAVPFEHTVRCLAPLLRLLLLPLLLLLLLLPDEAHQLLHAHVALARDVALGGIRTLLGLEVKVVQPRNGVLCAEVVRAELGLQDLQACLLVLHSQRIERWLHQGQRNGDGVVRGRRLNVVSAQQALVYLQGLLEIAQAETHPPLALLHHRDVDVGGRGVGVLLAHAEVEEVQRPLHVSQCEVDLPNPVVEHCEVPIGLNGVRVV
mmetsp:Transcript_10270/g.35438  ORF Transcript_10270/g.35438 Transcript_10270/m.35438 type:complete len:230 (+) Transcript_10270:322-1011(+)